MALATRLIGAARALLHRSAEEETLRREIDDYLARLVEVHLASGLNRVDAERLARAQLGSVEAVMDNTRDAGLESILNTFLQDARYATRSLIAARTFSIVVIVTLSLGIGANTAIFSVVNSLLFRSLPVAHAERLAVVSSGQGTDGVAEPWSYGIWQELEHRAGLFEAAGAWAFRPLALSIRGSAARAEGVLVSGDFFSTLGVKPVAGRLLQPSDDVRGSAGAHVAVISYGFWQRQYGATPEALGAGLVIDGVPFTIVGVTPREFFGAEVGKTFDVAVPLAAEDLLDRDDSLLDRQRTFWLSVIVRLRPGQTLAAATSSLRSIQGQIRATVLGPFATEEMRERFMPEPLTAVSAATGLSELRQQYRQPALALLAIVLVLLVLACANLANLFLARRTARQHQVSIRLALGATPARVARQLVIENLILALSGASVGLLLASWASTALVARLSSSLGPVFLDVALDGRVLAFTVCAALLTAAIFGTFPAFTTATASPIDAMRHNSRTATAQGAGVARGLAVAQVTLSVVLMVAAGLFLRSFLGLASIPRGFNADRIIVVEMDESGVREGSPEAFRRQAIEAVRRVPGVAQASLSATTPLANRVWNVVVEIPGGTSLSEQERTASGNRVTPGWFATYGVAILHGRDVGAGDNAASEPVAVVNEAFVARFFGGGDVVGRYVIEAPDSRRIQRRIVGVVANLVSRSLREVPPPALYVPLAQTPYFDREPVSLSVRAASGSPELLVRGLSQALKDVAPQLTFESHPLQQQVDRALARERMLAWVSGFFGLVAIALAGVGLYGVTAYSVERRHREIGIRLALGAQRTEIFRLIVGHSLITTFLGVLLGLAAAGELTRYLTALLFGLTPLDPQTFALASLLLMGVGALGALVPAYRATQADPRLAIVAE